MVRPLRVLQTVPSYFPYVTDPTNQVRQISRRLASHGSPPWRPTHGRPHIAHMGGLA